MPIVNIRAPKSNGELRIPISAGLRSELLYCSFPWSAAR
jgi:hypothetical protein